MFLLLFLLPLVNSDPDIDFIDINDALPDHCNYKECPRFTKIKESGLPKMIEHRLYKESYWISTTSYSPVNDSCLEGQTMTGYYAELFNFFKGVNTMGLLMDRTTPVRVVGQKHWQTGRLEVCYMMFYIPTMYNMNPPAPLAVNIFLGYNNAKGCYTFGKKGNSSWKKLVKLQSHITKYLTASGRSFLNKDEIIIDMFSGYGVPNNLKYTEISIC